MDGRTRSTRRKGKAGVGTTVALVLAAAISLGGLSYVGFLLWPSWPAGGVPAETPALPVTVSGVLFKVPPAAIRIPLQRRAGAQSRLDLAFLWPTLTPPHSNGQPATSEDSKAADQLFVSISARQDRLRLDERMKTIYPRYAADNAFTGPEGLVGVSFRDGTPYQGEDLYFQETPPHRFVARCTRDTGPIAGACLIEEQVGEAEIVIRFPRGWLPDWQKLAQGVDTLLARLRQGSA
jgi:hypothetical protein